MINIRREHFGTRHGVARTHNDKHQKRKFRTKRLLRQEANTPNARNEVLEAAFISYRVDTTPLTPDYVVLNVQNLISGNSKMQHANSECF